MMYTREMLNSCDFQREGYDYVIAGITSREEVSKSVIECFEDCEVEDENIIDEYIDKLMEDIEKELNELNKEDEVENEIDKFVDVLIDPEKYVNM